MKGIFRKSFAISTAAGLWLVCQSAFAVPVTVVQDYEIAGNPNFREDLTNTLITATIRFDNGSLTGTGIEYISADSIGLVFSDRGLAGLVSGLNFSGNVLNSPPFAPVSTFKAKYVDDVYNGFGWVDDGGGIPRALFGSGGVFYGINLISFVVGGYGQLSSACGGNCSRYNMFAIGAPTITIDTVGAVPIPAALPLFGTGLALMGFFGWRRKRKIAAMT